MGRILYLITITGEKLKLVKNSTLEVLFKEFDPTSISIFHNIIIYVRISQDYLLVAAFTLMKYDR